MIEYLEIEHFKGFFESEKLSFSEYTGLPGSGLTLIIGPNNTGKTTVIEALLINTDKKFKESERHPGHPPKIIIKPKDKDALTFTNVSNGSQVACGSKIPKPLFEVIQSRRYWDHNSPGDMPMQEFSRRSETFLNRNNSDIGTSRVLATINRNPEQKKSFNKLVSKIIPHFTDWTIDTNDQNDYVKYITADVEHQANHLGDGFLSIFRICAHLIADEKNRTLIIDEPELSLNPSAQKQLAKVISELSADRQVIICTHSPYFVNWTDFLNGAKYIRLNKRDDKKCTVSVLKNNEYERFIKGSHSNWQKPQLLDLAAKEIFFSEKILFMEGQEDVGLIKKWFLDNNISVDFDVFGYGVGGAGNMKLLLKLANDLGIERVSAIFDGDKKEECRESNSEFPTFHIVSLDKDDIRDKYSNCKTCGKTLIKEGIFDDSGKLKSDDTSFKTLMEGVLEYMR